MSTKATPKGCSCQQCKFAKHSKGGNHLVKLEEKAFRHSQKQALRKQGLDFVGDPAGSRERIG